MNKIATTLATFPAIVFSTWCLIGIGETQYGIQFKYINYCAIILALTSAVIYSYFAAKSPLQRRWVYGSWLFLIFCFSTSEAHFAEYNSKKKQYSIGIYDCNWTRTHDDKNRTMVAFNKDDKFVLKVKWKDDISFSKNGETIYTCNEKLISKDLKFPKKYDCNDAAEPNTYDVFIWLDLNLFEGKSDGAMKVDVPYPNEVSKKYINPRYQKSYLASVDEYNCKLQK